MGLVTLLLVTAAQPGLAGRWESSRYFAELAVRGKQVTGTFTRFDGDTEQRGTIAGTLGDDGRSFEAAWTYQLGTEAIIFHSFLVLAKHGRTLNGSEWTDDHPDIPRALGLRRAAGETVGEFITEENEEAATATPEQPAAGGAEARPATLDPPRGSTIALNIWNNNPRLAKPTAPSVLKLDQPQRLCVLRTFHWNDGRGAAAGRLGLAAADGTVYGPWTAWGVPDSTGHANVYWVTVPAIVLPAGEYNVVDSDPATWTQNAQSGGAGFAQAFTLPVDGAAPAAEPVTLLDNSNDGAVRNKPAAPTRFEITRAHRITLLRTYHWNDGRGATAGTIALQSADGRRYGPWPARGAGGNAGRANLMWIVEPNLDLPPGTYTIIDSDAATWACNDGSRGAGIAWVVGVPK